MTDTMRIGLTISAVAHAGVLLWSLVSFAAKPFETMPTDSLPVDIISATEFSHLTAGSKAAPAHETPKPHVEKIADKKPEDNPAPKVVEKPEIVATVPEPKRPDPPKPDPPKPDAKPAAFAPQPRNESKPEPK
jgi:colicin import membrane protein